MSRTAFHFFLLPPNKPIMKNKMHILMILCFVIIIGCRNPFFPPTGTPIDEPVSKQRSTPQGLLDQLIESYEGRRIDLFIDLLPEDGTFRFFIAPDYFDEYTAKYTRLSESRDPRLKFIGQAEYYLYWTQEDEIEKHKRLFSKATNIDFREKPTIESVRKFTDNGDSLAELLITGGCFEYTWYPDAYTIEIFIVNVTQQVFLIRKEKNGLWAIIKWYDFSTGGGQ